VFFLGSSATKHTPNTRFVWRIFQIAFNLISTPKDIVDLFGPWINSFCKTEKNWFSLGVVLPFGQFGELEMIVASMLI
jgi:hypothetical protein